MMQPARKQIVLLLVALVLALFIGLGSPTRNYRKVVFQGVDGVGVPGEEIEIGAMLERRDHLGMRRKVPGIPVTFHLHGRLLGGAMTNAEGVATIGFLPTEAGQYDIEARIDTPDFSSLTTGVFVAAMAEDDHILVIDVDHTIAKAPRFPGSLLGNYADLEPIEGARDAVADLYEDYQIFYLTERSDRHVETTKAWLAKNGFPPGPIHFKRGSFLARGASHRQRAILKLKEKWSHVGVGIGDSREDAELFLSCGLRAYILDLDSGVGLLPAGSDNIPNWVELVYLVRRNF
jgi:phosphatidate phosphatase APP1